MPLHTRFRPACEEAFCPHYDTARQNFASKVRRSSWENHLFQRLLGMVCTIESKEMILPR